MTRISRLKYKHKITLVIFACTLVPFIILSTFYVIRMWDDRVRSTLSSNENQLRLAVDNLDSFLTGSVQKLAYINSNTQVTSFLEEGYTDDLMANITFNDNMMSIVNALITDNTGIKLTLYSMNASVYSGRYILNRDELFSGIRKEETGLREKIQQLTGDQILWRFRYFEKNNYDGDSGEWLCLYRLMTSVDRPLAITEMRISFTQLARKFNLDLPSGSFILYQAKDDPTVRILKSGGPDKTAIAGAAAGVLSGGRSHGYHAVSVGMKYNADRILMFLPDNYVNSSLNDFAAKAVLILLLISVMLFFIVEIVSHFLTKRLTVLLEKVNSNIDNMESLEVFGGAEAGDDIGRLGTKFVELIQKIKEYYAQLARYDSEKKTLELELLQSRINPHFLYNTLSTMKWSCANERLAGVIDSMVAYYRMALNKGEAVQTVRQEMKMVEEYLKILQFTYESDFVYHIELEESIRECKITRHLLQPVVENAVMHGINGLSGGGVLEITGKMAGGNIAFQIKDNGVGMSPEKTRQLLCGELKNKLGGYGIKNVQKRLALYYGGEYGIQIESAEKAGTTVTLTIPAIL